MLFIASCAIHAEGGVAAVPPLRRLAALPLLAFAALEFCLSALPLLLAPACRGCLCCCVVCPCLSVAFVVPVPVVSCRRSFVVSCLVVSRFTFIRPSRR